MLGCALIGGLFMHCSIAYMEYRMSVYLHVHVPLSLRTVTELKVSVLKIFFKARKLNT